jgi:hypothetical protein
LKIRTIVLDFQSYRNKINTRIFILKLFLGHRFSRIAGAPSLFGGWNNGRKCVRESAVKHKKKMIKGGITCFSINLYNVS